MKSSLSIIVFFMGTVFQAQGQINSEDAILGKWMNAENDLAVEVYKQNSQFKAKVIWFACYDGTKMSDFYDKKNPETVLRNRPWLGMEVLNTLKFKGKGEWNNGHIYDPNTGRTLSSVCRLETLNILKVRGFWLYEWLGKNLVFHRMNN
jgi:uncharacterized protein (DUF2147 family)